MKKNASLKNVLGCIRKADQDFDMIQDGENVAVGVSGGKDSLLLLVALSLYRNFIHKRFVMKAFTLRMGFEPFDTAPVAALCNQLEVPYIAFDTDIAGILFTHRKESNPCALCAKLRRGVLNSLALEHGCRKLALGHHREDALETLLMSLIYEGRLHTFHPSTYLSRCGVTVIRPMVYLPESCAARMAAELQLPVIHNPCPANGNTKRQEIKELLTSLNKTYPGLKERMLHALQNKAQYGLWD